MKLRRLLPAVAVVALVACGGDSKLSSDQSGAASPNAAPSASAESELAGAGPLTPEAGGKVIQVELVSDGEGNYFKPREVHANRGDVVRFVLKVGVHNVHFLPDSNAGLSGYPQKPGDFLQLPGQTWDVAVKMPAGNYFFQCDPHAALGMTGHLMVH